MGERVSFDDGTGYPKPVLRNTVSEKDDSGSECSKRVYISGKPSFLGPIELLKDQTEQHRPWKTSLIRFGPLSGLFCMLLAIASLVASLGVLAGSNKHSIKRWPTPPATYLAIFVSAQSTHASRCCIIHHAELHVPLRSHIDETT